MMTRREKKVTILCSLLAFSVITFVSSDVSYFQLNKVAKQRALLCFLTLTSQITSEKGYNGGYEDSVVGSVDHDNSYTHYAAVRFIPATWDPMQNTWHQSFNSSCPPGHQLSQWETYFRKCQGDRIHYFHECRPGPASGDYEQDCSWTDYLNSPTQYFFSTCPNNGYVAGQVSTFDPAASDRRYSDGRERAYKSHSFCYCSNECRTVPMPHKKGYD